MYSYDRGVTLVFYQFNGWMSRKELVSANLF